MRSHTVKTSHTVSPGAMSIEYNRFDLICVI